MMMKSNARIILLLKIKIKKNLLAILRKWARLLRARPLFSANRERVLLGARQPPHAPHPTPLTRVSGGRETPSHGPLRDSAGESVDGRPVRNSTGDPAPGGGSGGFRSRIMASQGARGAHGARRRDSRFAPRQRWRSTLLDDVFARCARNAPLERRRRDGRSARQRRRSTLQMVESGSRAEHATERPRRDRRSQHRRITLQDGGASVFAGGARGHGGGGTGDAGRALQRAERSN